MNIYKPSGTSNIYLTGITSNSNSVNINSSNITQNQVIKPLTREELHLDDTTTRIQRKLNEINT